MNYIIESSLLLALFYMSYKWFLERETFFQNIRFFLLLGLITAIVIPLIVIPNYIEYTPQNDLLSNLDQYTSTTNAVEDNSIELLNVLILTYYLGVLFFLGRLVIQFISLKLHLSKSQRDKKEGRILLLETNEDIPPFSFFNRIVYNPSQFSSEELKVIIKHEIAHVKEFHSFDLVIAHLTCIVFWFNPFAWLYKKSIKQNLEFIADHITQEETTCDTTYQTTILKACVGRNQLSIINNFSNSSQSLRIFGRTYTFGKPLGQIKKRIVMLQSSKSNTMRQLKFLIVLPLITIFMMSFNTKDIYVPIEDQFISQQDTTEQWNVLKFTVNKTTNDDQLEDIKKRFKAKDATVNFNNIQRDENGYITSIAIDFKSGKSKGNFSTDEEGPIKDIVLEYDVENETLSIHNVNHDMSQTIKTGTTRVKIKNDSESQDNNVWVEKMGDSGASAYTYTIKKGTGYNSFINNDSIFIARTNYAPLVLLNGKVISEEEMSEINPNIIKSVNVLKDDQAIKGYGQKGKNGVVIIDTNGSSNYGMGYSAVDIKNDNNTTITYKIKNTDEPLYVVNGTIIHGKRASTISPENINSINVLKGNKATTAYGYRGKNGVIEIETKDKPSQFVSSNGGVFVYKNAAETIEYVINKDTKEERLEILKNEFKLKNMDLKFSKVRRNKKGEITSIKVTLDDNQGKKSTVTFKEKDETIPNIVLGKQGNDIILRSLN